MVRSRSPLPIPELQCPLGDEHCELLDRTLASCNDLQCYLEKLQAAGLDVSAWMQESRSNEALATRLKAIHFPDRS